LPDNIKRVEQKDLETISPIGSTERSKPKGIKIKLKLGPDNFNMNKHFDMEELKKSLKLRNPKERR